MAAFVVTTGCQTRSMYYATIHRQVRSDNLTSTVLSLYPTQLSSKTVQVCLDKASRMSDVTLVRQTAPALSIAITSMQQCKRDHKLSALNTCNEQRSQGMDGTAKLHNDKTQACAGARKAGGYWELRVTALVPSMTACLASSPPRSSRTPVWISLEVRVFLPATGINDLESSAPTP